MGNRKTRRYYSPDALGVGPVEFHENKHKGNLFFAFHFFFPNYKRLIHQKVNPGVTVKEEIPWVFPFCSVFWNCPHLLVKAVSQESKQHWVESLFIPASDAGHSADDLKPACSLVSVKPLFLRSNHSPLNLCFPSLNRRVYGPEAYFVAETCFVFNPASFTTQNKLCIYI